MRAIGMVVAFVSGCCALGQVEGGQGSVATGVVFDDLNKNGTRDAGEAGVPDVRVSNGQDIVRTDKDGRYRLGVEDDTALFVIKPRNWMTRVDKLNLPRFYHLHKPAGSPKLKYPGVAPTGPLPASVDFPLYQTSEADRFHVLVFGDTQVRTIEEVNYLAHDIVEQVAGCDAAFSFSLGDLVYDRLELYEPLNSVMAQIGVPIYNVLGNHDENYAAANDQHADETYERVYGPSTYSFDYGPVHFIVLDDVMWHGATDEKKGHYTSDLSERQMTFLRNDLGELPKEQLVVLTMHIPIMEIAQREALYRLLAEHPHTVSFSAHWHTQKQFFLGKEDGWPGAKPHPHRVFVTACGCWWRGAPDELGIPHATMGCGAPNGWSMVTFDGNQYSIEFRAARRPANYQMNVHAPEVVAAAQTGQTEVLVNVFAGSERSTVAMRVGSGEWIKLERVEREDPYFQAIKVAEESEHPPRGGKLPRPAKSPHIWRGMLPANLARGAQLIEVRTTDMFGQTYFAGRIIRVE